MYCSNDKVMRWVKSVKFNTLGEGLNTEDKHQDWNVPLGKKSEQAFSWSRTRFGFEILHRKWSKWLAASLMLAASEWDTTPNPVDHWTNRSFALLVSNLRRCCRRRRRNLQSIEQLEKLWNKSKIFPQPKILKWKSSECEKNVKQTTTTTFRQGFMCRLKVVAR